MRYEEEALLLNYLQYKEAKDRGENYTHFERCTHGAWWEKPQKLWKRVSMES